ncbi:hypothetical protein F2Q69_00029054 [Brassica cretica]|uniref:Uncharacterized protein n=1 Tax=Brassica cretica TaxID=69181 RepID=A0A8S9S3T9_BRACR|nr:hypothetical protein F2Q69_00029054 [Brassica cretica]
MAAHNMHTEEYDEDYEEEQAIEQRATLDEEDRLLHHSFWKKKSPSIDRNGSPSIDTQSHQQSHLRASTDIAYYPSIDTNVDATRDGEYSIGSLADDRHHESYAVETAYRDQGDDELHEGFTYEDSTCKDAMKHIRNEQKPLGKEYVSAIRSTEIFLHRSTSILQHRWISTIQHRSTAVQNQKPL